MDWLNNNGAAVQGIAAVVQGIATLVLVGVTIYYAISTRKIADKTQDMAVATEGMADLTRQQRLDSVRPVDSFAFMQDGAAPMDRFEIVATNVGTGPALDFRLELTDSPIRYRQHGPVFPMVVPSGGQIEMTFHYDKEHPYAEESIIKWPRDESEAKIQAAADTAAVTPLPSGGMKGPQSEHDKIHARRRQFEAFTRDIIAVSKTFDSTGTLVATYRDLHRRRLTSSVTLLVEPTSPESWNNLKFGPVVLEDPH